MNDLSSIRLLNVLTPIIPGHEGALSEHFAQLAPRDGGFARVPSVHFARWVPMGQLRARFGSRPMRRAPLRMTYLLFTCGFNGTVEDFLEDARTTIGTDLDAVWNHCVGYPGHQSRSAFHQYLQHNRLPIPHDFIDYDYTVTEIREALELRRKHLELAMKVQASGGASSLPLFREVFQ